MTLTAYRGSSGLMLMRVVVCAWLGEAQPADWQSCKNQGSNAGLGRGHLPMAILWHVCHGTAGGLEPLGQLLLLRCDANHKYAHQDAAAAPNVLQQLY